MRFGAKTRFFFLFFFQRAHRQGLPFALLPLVRISAFLGQVSLRLLSWYGRVVRALGQGKYPKKPSQQLIEIPPGEQIVIRWMDR